MPHQGWDLLWNGTLQSSDCDCHCLGVSGCPTPSPSPVLMSLTQLAMHVNVFQPKTLARGGGGYCGDAEGAGAAAGLWGWTPVFYICRRLRVGCLDCSVVQPKGVGVKCLLDAREDVRSCRDAGGCLVMVQWPRVGVVRRCIVRGRCGMLVPCHVA